MIPRLREPYRRLLKHTALLGALFCSNAALGDEPDNGAITYTISSRWAVGASAYAARLQSDAEESPVTLRRPQITVIAFLTYKVL
jgi:hypothetical protein